MTAIGLVLLIVGVVIVGLALYWVITKFFTEQPLQQILLMLAGLLLLTVLLYNLWPSGANFQLWK